MPNRPAPNVVGKRFGMLVVMDQRRGKRGTECLCQCDCGNKKWINYSHLVDKRRPVKSCGCLGKATDLHPGDRFGMLTAVRREGSSPSGDRQYLCKCDCGGEITATSYQLRSGMTTSCGCKLRAAQTKLGEKSAKGVAACIKDGVNIFSATREAANRNSKSGIRGVWYDPKRHCFLAKVVVCGERWFGYGYVSAESAKRDRDKKHEELLKKYGVKDKLPQRPGA